MKKLHTELARKFESQKAAMATEIRQLEERLATLLQQQSGQHGGQQAAQNTEGFTSSLKEQQTVCSQLKDHQAKEQACHQPCQCRGTHICQMSGSQVALSSRGGEAMNRLLKDTAGSVKKDVLQLVSQY